MIITILEEREKTVVLTDTVYFKDITIGWHYKCTSTYILAAFSSGVLIDTSSNVSENLYKRIAQLYKRCIFCSEADFLNTFHNAMAAIEPLVSTAKDITED